MTTNKILHVISSCDFGGGTKHLAELSKIHAVRRSSFFAVVLESHLQKTLHSESDLLELSQKKVHLSSILTLNKFINQNNVNILHAHGRGAALVARILKIFKRKRIRVFHTLHGVHKNYGNFLLSILYRLYEYIFNFTDDYRVFVSNSEAKEYSTFCRIAQQTKHRIIYNACEKSLRSNCEDSHYDVGVLTRLHYQKNLLQFVDIAKKMPERRFIVGGEGPEYKKLLSRIEKENIKNITLCGYVSDTSAFMKNIKIYVSTSLWEGLPYSVLEALSHEKPLVLSRVPGHIDFVYGKTSVDFFDTSSKAANLIKRLLSSEQEYKNSISRSIIIKEKFSFANFEKQMINLYGLKSKR